jgi:hypothetical protein
MALNDGGVSDPRLERLYREAAREGPPAHLDAAILAAARREVGARPRASSYVLRRWHVPVSIAAVVVVSVSLVILVREEGGERIGEIRRPPAAAPAERSDAAPTQTPPTVAKQAAQPQLEESARAAQGASREEQRLLSAPSIVQDTTGRERDSAAASGVRLATPETAAAPPSPSFPAAPPQLAQERATAPAAADRVATGRLGAAAPEPIEKRTAPAADAPPARTTARALAVKPALQERPPVWQGFEKEPPEKWLLRIEALRREGRAAEAEEMRAEFKRRFPGHPLAQDAK